MDRVRDKICELIEENKISEINEITNNSAELKNFAQDIKFIMEGFSKLKVNHLSIVLKGWEKDIYVIESALKNTKRGQELKTLQNTLQSFESTNFSESNTKTKSFSLKRYYKYGIAASLFVICALCALIYVNQSFKPSIYYVEAQSLSSRSHISQSTIIGLAEDRRWDEIIDIKNQIPKSTIEEYYIGIALMMNKEYLKSNVYLEKVIKSKLPEYADLALYHKMVNLYALKDSDYLKIKKMFTLDPKNQFYDRAIKLNN